VLIIKLLSCLRSDIVILDTLIVLLTYLLTYSPAYGQPVNSWTPQRTGSTGSLVTGLRGQGSGIGTQVHQLKVEHLDNSAMAALKLLNDAFKTCFYA